MAALLLAAAVASTVWSQEAGSRAPKPDPAACDRSQFRVVVDVGHTAEAHGAMSARNVPEYDFNFNLAWQIQHSLIANGFTKTVLLVTDGDARPSLFKRVGVANQLSANLFLSIHHDSVPDVFLENWEFEDKPSHFSDRFSGHSLFVADGNARFDDSLAFAVSTNGTYYAYVFNAKLSGAHTGKAVVTVTTTVGTATITGKTTLHVQ